MANEMTSIKVEYNVLQRELTELERTTFPIAFAKSLTFVAQNAAEAVRDKTRKTYKLHTDFIPKGIAISSATSTRLESAVFTKDIISRWMPKHETGGNVSPVGKSFSLPGKTLLQSIVFKTRTGAVKTKYKPKELLKVYNQTRGELVAKGSKGHRKEPFVMRGKNSCVPMIVKRRSRKRYPLQVLYVFSSKAKYKPDWKFEPTVRRIVNEQFAEIFARVWAAEQRKH
jgi:hypothetical protein